VREVQPACKEHASVITWTLQLHP